MIKDICPHCEKVTSLEFIQRQDNINVRGDSIEVEDRFFLCLECNEEFDDPRSPYDVLDIAYKAYRHQHGMLQPDEIRAWREKNNFSQDKLSGILFWSVETLNSYK